MGHVHVSLFQASFSVLCLCQSYTVLITVVSLALLCSSISSVFFPSLNFPSFTGLGMKAIGRKKTIYFFHFHASLPASLPFHLLSLLCVCVSEKIDLARSEKQYLTAPSILVLVNQFPYFLHIPWVLTHPKNVLLKQIGHNLFFPLSFDSVDFLKSLPSSTSRPGINRKRSCFSPNEWLIKPGLKTHKQPSL